MFIGYCRFYIGQICNSTLPHQIKKNLVSEICEDSIWKEVWHEYPIHLMSKGHRLMAFLMQHNYYMAMMLIYKLKKRN